mmetsp:Transcript_16470/g.51508  ORF Transcript_16470/g.51508 Transcript_16470/m.51508 type:complete len:84 (-) Transcript_16470:844-1095(-)
MPSQSSPTLSHDIYVNALAGGIARLTSATLLQPIELVKVPTTLSRLPPLLLLPHPIPSSLATSLTHSLTLVSLFIVGSPSIST